MIDSSQKIDSVIQIILFCTNADKTADQAEV